jgi:hypothetical protein
MLWGRHLKIPQTVTRRARVRVVTRVVKNSPEFPNSDWLQEPLENMRRSGMLAQSENPAIVGVKSLSGAGAKA